MESKKAIEKAIDLWERVVQLNPTHLDAIFLLARTGALSSLFFFLVYFSWLARHFPARPHMCSFFSVGFLIFFFLGAFFGCGSVAKLCVCII